ncbi:hypothetical protein [Amphritea sp.]|uniref:hypothetical protein n=1 Tax=Amphritea sp. TaxID=1872502 RepID=UPI003D112F8D
MNRWIYPGIYSGISPWLNLFKSPLSGDVTQDISPVTSWWSPQIELNFAGNRPIENAVVRDVASYGKQLGIITDVLLQLTKDETGEAVDQLRKVSDDVERIKQKHLSVSMSTLKAGLLRLKTEDPEGYKKLLDELQQG